MAIYWGEWPGYAHDVLAEHPELAQEVRLEHPENSAFAELQLQGALPVLADMALKIGGIVYPFAPLTDTTGTEIGAAT